MLRNNRFRSFAECLDGRHPFDAEEAQQNLRTSALNDPERKGLLELLAELIAQLPEAPKKVLAIYYYEGSKLADIAVCFNLTEPQICQIRTEAVDELRMYPRGAWVERERNGLWNSKPHKEVRHTTMAHYVDGFVIPVPESKIDDYRRIAQKAGEEPQ